MFVARSVLFVTAAVKLFEVERPRRNCPAVVTEARAKIRARKPPDEVSLKLANHAPPAVGSAVNRAVNRA